MVDIVDGNLNRYPMRGENFRLTVDPPGMTIKSTHFQLRDEGAEIVLFNGRGWGHGLGLCQWGAEGMARRGMSAERILRHYFPGSKLVKAYE
jgi:stage II sporulation protein D